MCKNKVSEFISWFLAHKSVSCEFFTRFFTKKFFTIRNEMTAKKTSAHVFISSKQEWLIYWIGHFSRTSPETNFHFIFPTMESSVNKISFMAGWNFILGRFLFGSHINFIKNYQYYQYILFDLSICHFVKQFMTKRFWKLRFLCNFFIL